MERMRVRHINVQIGLVRAKCAGSGKQCRGVGYLVQQAAHHHAIERYPGEFWGKFFKSAVQDLDPRRASRGSERFCMKASGGFDHVHGIETTVVKKKGF